MTNNNIKPKDNNTKKTKNRRKVSSIITIFLMVLTLIAGIFFSTQHFTTNFRLGNDFRGHFSALVAVDDLSSTAPPSQAGQPNGNAQEAAAVLEQRLNPMGTNQIIIETAGLNYLNVLSPIDAHGSEIEFRNQIQRNGGAIILDGDLNDMQFNGDERLGISDFFSSANATTIPSNLGRNPAIEFELYGGTLMSFFGEDSEFFQATIMIDADGLFNDIRNWFSLVSGELRQRVESFYDNIINVIRVVYNQSTTTELQRRILDDLFTGRYMTTTTGNVQQFRYINVLNLHQNNREMFINAFMEHIENGFEYASETSRYVYDPNATTDDFLPGGTFSQILTGYSVTAGGGFNLIELAPVREVFAAINPLIVNFVRQNITSWAIESLAMETRMQSYFLMDGIISSFSSQPTGFIVNSNSFISNQYLIIEYTDQPESKARIGAAIFNASTRGFVFTVNSISLIDASITSIMFWLAAVLLIIFALALLIYSIIVYKFMAIFMFMILGTIVMLTLLASTWFALTLGVEAIFAILIIVAINLEIFATIFEQAKYNLYLKQRNVKVSFSIAVKETITLAIDMLIALIIPAISMFWISTNAIQSFAIMTLMGVAFSFGLTLIFGIILFKLIISTNIFEKHPTSFVLNTEFVNKNNFILNFKLNKLTQEKLKLQEKNDLTKIDKIDKKILTLEEKINNKIKTNQEKDEKLKIKYDLKIENKIKKLENKKIKKPKKSFKYNLKIEELQYILKDDTQIILENESEITISSNEKIKTSLVEKNIKRSSKILIIILMILTGMAALVGGIFGPNFDNTFGNRTEYTVWGNRLEQVYTAIQNVPNRNDVDEDFREDLHNLIESQANYSEIAIEYFVSQFLELLFLRPEVVNQVARSTHLANNRQFRQHDFSVSHGPSFVFSSGSVVNENIPWVRLSVMTINPWQSQVIRNVFTAVGGLNNNQTISESGGYITKRIRPFTASTMTIQIMYVLITIIAALAIYILIRFKWTYYIAMVIGIIIAPAVALAVIIGLHINFGIGTLVALVVGIMIMISTMISVFGKSRSLIATKDESSLNQFFKEEINLFSALKNKKNQIKNEIFVRKTEYKISLKTEDLSKEQKQELKIEFKKYKHEKWLIFKDEKKETKIQINRFAKKNNYLKEVLAQTFKFAIKRSILVGFLYISFSVLFSIAFLPLASVGISVIITVVAAMATMLLICLPIWVALEQIRIRNYLSRKHFINNLKVESEEQIIERVND